MRKLICKLFGHKWVTYHHNHMWQKCKRCKAIEVDEKTYKRIMGELGLDPRQPTIINTERN